MRASLRLGLALWTAGLALAPSRSFAQTTTQPTTNTTSPDTVGPKELQNFSLPGNVTQPAPQPATPIRIFSRTQQAPAQTTQSASQPVTQAVAPSPTRAPTTDRARRTDVSLRSTTPTPAVAQAEPTQRAESSPAPAGAPPASAAVSSPVASPGFAPEDPPTATLAPEHKLPVLPWLLAALALAAGGAFLFWRNRSREAFAGGPSIDTYSAPEAAPPRSAPPAPPAAPPAGIVSTRLRPWIEIGFQPVRCILEEQQVVIEFELDLFNSGSAPARAVLAEASLFNAGPTQDRELAAFFDKPVGKGERIVAINPLKRVTIQTRVVAAREQLQAYEIAGKHVFVPVIAFNALYHWSGGEGQTSSSYLLGRDTKGEKMAPFRLDLGPRIFRGVGAHRLQVAVRR